VSENPASFPKRSRWSRFIRISALLSIPGIVFFFLLGIMMGSVSSILVHDWGRASVQTSHSIYLAMFQYSVDNNGDFPDGKSSTEIFQKLMDGGYITDPKTFYIPLAGKIEGTSSKLQPENVCWDVTASPGKNDSGELPLIFMTGYKVAYVPGGAAVPLIKPHLFGFESRTWLEWWQGKPTPPTPGDFPGIAVVYENGSSAFRKMSQPDGTIPNFIAATFDPKGKTYRQLTPEGLLP
jgi:hypothetical protein